METAEMSKVLEYSWKLGEDGIPKRILCPNGAKYPEHDAEGETIYENSHYSTEREAWASSFKNRHIGISWAARDVVDAEKALNTAKDKCVEATRQLNSLIKAFEGRYGRDSAMDGPTPPGETAKQ